MDFYTIFAVTFVMSAVLICKWTLSHYDDDDDEWKSEQRIMPRPIAIEPP